MSEKITFKNWLANLWKGSWQALCWVGRAFIPKNKTPFWRVVWSIITICVMAVSGCLVHSYVTNVHENCGCADIHRISHNYKFVRSHDELGSIVHLSTGEVIQKDIEWIALPYDEDSLMVYSKNGKRGYINRFSGEVSIPAKYTKAWLFSDGIAGVAQGDSVFFIDHSGKPIDNKKLRYNPKNSAYIFHGDYCVLASDNGKMGLIDRNFNWVIEPFYDWIIAEKNNFWNMRKGDNESGLWYAFNDKAEQVFDTGYPKLDFTEDLGIVASLPNHLQISYSYDGIKSEKFLIKEVEKMYYNKDEWDEEGNMIVDATTLMRYRMPAGYEGLCTVNGDIVTEPLYWEIQPLTKNTYLCKYKDINAGVIINSKGQIIGNRDV